MVDDEHDNNAPIILRTIPIGDALPGLEIRELMPKSVPLAAVLIIKVIDENGDTAWALRETPGVDSVEELGALYTLLKRSERAFNERWRAFEEGDPDA